MDNFRRTMLSKQDIFDPVTGRGIVDGYEVVDFGLPSGLLWATCNVGATNEKQSGNFYQWGAGAVSYAYANQWHTGGTDPGYTLPSSADTATQVMGEEWRMPTEAELTELFNNTDFGFTFFNGVNGCKFTHKNNTNIYIFFPATGFFYNNKFLQLSKTCQVWGSTLNNNREPVRISSDSGATLVDGAPSRWYGFCVRGVHAAV